MEPNAKDPRHFLKHAGNITEASCFGRYMAMSIEKVLFSVPIIGRFHSESRKGKFTLIRILFSNIWDHRIDVRTHDMKLIDTEGIQHSHETDDLYIYQSETEVSVSSKRNQPYDFAPHATTLEGKAKTRGWLWFPALPQGIYPHRLIFNFFIFAPGYTSGAGEDHETLEVEFDFKFRELLPSAKNFVTLEIEDV
jgi:hypothetical protein